MSRLFALWFCPLACGGLLLFVERSAPAQDAEKGPPTSGASASEDAAPIEAPEVEAPAKKSKLPPHLVALNPKETVILDKKRKRVILQGEVCLNRGPLEVFACLKGTKEHESIVAIDTEAVTVHAALVAAGIEPGSPALWQPEFKSAEGPEIAVTIFWTGDDGKRQHAKAQDWIRNARSGEVMDDHWVFGGSMFEKRKTYQFDPKTKKRVETGEKEFYLGEEGFLISVSNFTSAVLDVPVQSSDSNVGLLFEALTERIPPVGTKVQIVLSRAKKADASDAAPTKEEEPKDENPESADEP